MDDQALWLSTAGVLIAMLAIPATIWATRRWGTRRARLELEVEVVPMLPKDRPGALAVTFVDIPVPDPHLVTLEIRNVGPRDVPSSAFDSGEPLKVHFQSAFYGVTRSAGGGSVVAPAVGTSPPQAVVRMAPSLLKRGEVWSFTAIVSGADVPRIESPLVDTDIYQTAPGPAQAVTVQLLGAAFEVPLPRKKSRVRD